MRGKLAGALVGVVATWSVAGHAQSADAGASAPPATTSPPPTTTTSPKAQVTLPSEDTLHWPELYAAGKQALLDGEWEKAASSLEGLVESAPTPEDARAAKELAQLARYWQKRDVAFVQRQALGESDLSAKAVDRRSVDEIVTLYATMAFYGAGLGLSLAAIATPANQQTSAPAFIVPAIVGTGMGIGGVALADNFGRLRYGQPQAIASGTWLGLAEGLLFIGWQASNTGGSWDAKAYVGVGVATTTAGAVLGGVLGAVLPLTPGRASWVSSVGLWGGALVAGVSSAIVGGINSSNPPTTGNRADGVFLSTLVGYNAGIVGGFLTAGVVSPSIGRVRLLDLGGIVGGATGFGIYAAAASGSQGGLDGYAALGITAIGIAAGLTTSWLLTMGMTPDRLGEPNQLKKPPAASIHPVLYPVQGGATAALAGTF